MPWSGGRAAWSVRWRLLAALGASLVGLLASCTGKASPRLLSAEFLDDREADGEPQQGETIRLTLDAPLRDDLDLASVRVTVDPPVDWYPVLERTTNPRVLTLRIATGAPALHPHGLYRPGGGPGNPTGLGLDLGEGTGKLVDLQPRRRLPVLRRAQWEDAHPPGGNGVVDQGDWLRLEFDQPVVVQGDASPPGRVRVPQEVLLSKAMDRLDDGSSEEPDADGSLPYAHFEPSERPDTIRLVLGRRPILVVPGVFGVNASTERFRPEAPSGISLNGTEVLPLPVITSRLGGAGVVSLGEIDIEEPESYPRPHAIDGPQLPGRKGLRDYVLCPIVAQRGLIVGGTDPDGEKPSDALWIYDPHFASRGSEALTLLPERLPHGVFDHTATVLAGGDGLVATHDDLIVVAGGTNGVKTFADLTALIPTGDGGVRVFALEERLLTPRSGHAAVAIASQRLLVDGGERRESAGLVGSAEVLTLEVGASGIEVLEHTSFRTLARVGHTLTTLPPTLNGKTFILAYGGCGRDVSRFPPTLPTGQPLAGDSSGDAFSAGNASVLSSPILLCPDAPDSSLEVELPFRIPHLRWGHQAFSLGGDAGGRGAQEPANAVLIAGGTNRHYFRPIQERDRKLWRLPLDELRMPEGHEAAHALLFRFDRGAPEQSKLEVLATPYTETSYLTDRTHFSAVRVPGWGVLLVGGEAYGQGPLSTIEVYLEEAEAMCPLAFPLTAPRSHHQGLLVERGGKLYLHLVGGITAPSSGAPPRVPSANIPFVEEVPLEWTPPLR